MTTIHFLTQIQFDHGAVALLPQECARVGITRPLVVTDAGRDVFDRVIAGALADHCHKTNPVVATSQDDRDLLEASL